MIVKCKCGQSDFGQSGQFVVFFLANVLIKQLRGGNLNPGIGIENIEKGIFEARSAGGARVYFKNRVEIVGYSNKTNTIMHVYEIMG